MSPGKGKGGKRRRPDLPDPDPWTDEPVDPDEEGELVDQALVRQALLETGIDLDNPAHRAAVLSAAAQVPEPRRDRRLTAAEKARRALELRTQGLPYEEIAELCGWKSKSAAHKAVTRALAELAQEPAEELRALELRRLDEMLAGLIWRARLGENTAVDRVLKIMQERRRYVPGVEVPATHELTGPGGGPLAVSFTLPPVERPAPIAEHELADRAEAGALPASPFPDAPPRRSDVIDVDEAPGVDDGG